MLEISDTDVCGDLLARVRVLRRRFAHTAPQSWDGVTASAEVSVQLGHLALCLLRHHDATAGEFDDPDRPINDVGDELADVLLGILSVCSLTGTDPVLDTDQLAVEGDAGDDYLRLVAACGRLNEAALVALGYHHQPEGRPPSIARDAGVAVRCCGALADVLGVDLLAEFEEMATDAHGFLDQRGVP